jgi:hypothetical protein
MKPAPPVTRIIESPEVIEQTPFGDLPAIIPLVRIVNIEAEQIGTCAYNALTAGERVALITTPPKAQTPITAQVGPANS